MKFILYYFRLTCFRTPQSILQDMNLVHSAIVIFGFGVVTIVELNATYLLIDLRLMKDIQPSGIGKVFENTLRYTKHNLT